MRLYKWELVKLLSAPAMWVFLALCLIFNILIIAGESYDAPSVNELSRYLAETGETRYTDGYDVFDGYDTGYVAEIFVIKLKLSGSAESLIRYKYKKLQAAVIRNAETNVGTDIYADVYTKYVVHKTLFQTILLPLLVESALFALLSALLTLGNEHRQKTESVIYGSKTGRGITRYKQAAALTTAAIGFILLFGLTLTIYFSIWDFSGFWRSNVQSVNNFILDEAGQRPFITWISLNVAQYLAAVIILGFALTTVFCLIGTFTGLLTRNTYMGFILVMLIAVTTIAAIAFCANNGLGLVYIALLFSPVAVWFPCSGWLTDMGSWGAVPFHETVTIVINLLLFSVLTILAARRFKRKDVL